MQFSCVFSRVTCEFLTVHLQTSKIDEPSSLQVFKVKPADGIPLCSCHRFLNGLLAAMSEEEFFCCNLIKCD